jgi:TRAP-type C4-dicarboxylate transport system permease small subunit
MLRALARAIDVVVDALAWIAGAVCLLMALHVAADLVGRSLFDHPLLGTDEIATNYYMVALAFLPLAVITRQRAHIVVGLFTDRLPRRALLGVGALADLVTLGFVAIVAWTAIGSAIEKTATREMTESSVGYLPIWEARWILALGFSMMCLYLVLNLAKDLLVLFADRRDRAA